MKISDEKKVDVLLLALKERYEAIHKIRERAQSIGIWALGILFTLGGWILKSDQSLKISNKALFVALSVLAFLVIKYSYLRDLENGFKSQQRAAAKIETALELYESGSYSQTQETIYDISWKDAGQSNGKGKFFKTTTYLLMIGFAFFVIAILAKDSYQSPRSLCLRFHHQSHVFLK